MAAEEYQRVRLAPPVEALEWMLSGREQVVLDRGAGTGQITRQLCARPDPRLDVVAVEPDPEMLAVLRRGCPDVRAFAGTAEAIPLADASVDTVLVGSAWHWFERDAALHEVARVLRPGGRLGVVGITADPFVPWVAELYGGRAEHYREFVLQAYIDVALPAGLFLPAEMIKVGVDPHLTVDEVQELFATFSYHITADDQERMRLDATIRATLSERFPDNQRVALPWPAWCWRTDRSA